ncbi:cupin domain-containing protein [Azorhizobium doebereinerae]|uniref:cupin domain-containing protein n=1 Tax=Azorhizobium doebereinerae TaxID=281091 RepID=UPI00040D1B2F|nr:cupin domain-containing protein [Azorhizobium doebereinerae]
MTSSLWHSGGTEAAISVPEMGMDLRVRLPPPISDGAITVVDSISAPGFGPPLHRFREAKVLRILSGRFLFEIDEVRFYAGPGDVVHVPRRAISSFLNVADAPAAQSMMYVPGLDAIPFFSGLGAVVRAGGGWSSPALAAYGARWGVEFVGPPLKE